MDLKATKYRVSEGIATIVLARPQRNNAWTGRMHAEYRHLLKRADEDTTVRVVVVTGEGRSFCVGADAKALEGHAERGGYDSGLRPEDAERPGFGVDRNFEADFAYHFGVSKPIIAAINGPCAGIGLVLACFCDLRFACAGAALTTAHGKLNLPAEYGLSWLLPRLIGLTKANDLLLSSRKFTAEEGAELGLINRVLPSRDALMIHAYEYARMLRDTVSAGALRETKWQIYRDQHQDVRSAVEAAAELLQAMMKEDDYKEGVKALLRKRPPRWGPARPPPSAQSSKL